jgi:hypothetical protein
MVGMMESWASGTHHHKYGAFGSEQGSIADASTTSLTAMTAATMGGGGPAAMNGSRGSLGKLIERSTSAPPSSVSSALSEGYLTSDGGYNVTHGSGGSSSGKPFGGLSLVGGVRV